MRLILKLFAIIKSGAMVLANKRSFWNFAKNYRALKGYPKITLDLSIINMGTQKFLLCRSARIQDPLPTLLFLRLPLCCFCDPLCCFCGPLCWNVFPFCWFGDPFCCFWSAKWECVFPKCHPPSRMLILYLSRINNSGPSKAKNQQFLSNKTESTNCIDQSLVGSFQDLQMIALWKLSLRRRQSSISHSILLSFLSLL